MKFQREKERDLWKSDLQQRITWRTQGSIYLSELHFWMDKVLLQSAKNWKICLWSQKIFKYNSCPIPTSKKRRDRIVYPHIFLKKKRLSFKSPSQTRRHGNFYVNLVAADCIVSKPSSQTQKECSISMQGILQFQFHANPIFNRGSGIKRCFAFSL